ncbi:streptophobe family protein [Streptomyces sp. SP18CS02]|uniref:streptophobe family protein n=1 Tax=Streptomyces sp. SP18CS02 TaxID=3002531 RepID=UPI002E78BD72|nr:streptophobe family protein [Streptomyces sp. SP18CS02]MEE1754774.1 streptophobe family protein [Streptomyces sp. SP18CS02]
MTGVAALGPRPLGTDASGALGPVTGAGPVLGAGGPVTPSGDVSVFGREGVAAETAVDITPLGVSLIRVSLLSYLFPRSHRARAPTRPAGRGDPPPSSASRRGVTGERVRSFARLAESHGAVRPPAAAVRAARAVGRRYAGVPTAVRTPRTGSGVVALPARTGSGGAAFPARTGSGGAAFPARPRCGPGADRVRTGSGGAGCLAGAWPYAPSPPCRPPDPDTYPRPRTPGAGGGPPPMAGSVPPLRRRRLRRAPARAAPGRRRPPPRRAAVRRVRRHQGSGGPRGRRPGA